MPLLTALLRVSRPHLWLYTAGPFSFGVLAAMAMGHTVSALWFTSWMIALTVPINVFIYGINDFFDVDTDAHNPKKNTLEYRATPKEYRLLVAALIGYVVVGAFIVYEDVTTWGLFALWTFLVLTYNMPPIRLKARPILDILLAFNYPLLGIIGYTMVAGVLPPIGVLIPITLLSISYHVYSAVHDMPHDAADGVYTTALWLGSATRAYLLCVACALGVVYYFAYLNWWGVAVAVLPYSIFYGAHLVSPLLQHDSLRSYQYFIYLQYGIGFCAVQACLYYLGFFEIVIK